MDFQLPTTLIAWAIMAFGIILTALTAIGVIAVINASKQNIESSLLHMLRKQAGIYVRALAQDPSLKGLASEEKKERAMLWLMVLAEKYHIELSEHDASLIIENEVWLMKNALTRISDVLLEGVELKPAA